MRLLPLLPGPQEDLSERLARGLLPSGLGARPPRPRSSDDPAHERCRWQRRGSARVYDVFQSVTWAHRRMDVGSRPRPDKKSCIAVHVNCEHRTTFAREMSPEATRLRTSAANPIARFVLSGVSSWADAAAVARSSSTTPGEGKTTRACRRSREDKEDTTACRPSCGWVGGERKRRRRNIAQQ